MTETTELLSTTRQVVEIFNKLNIPYHLTGGLSVILYSQPRTTLDIDIVVDAQSAKNCFAELIAECEKAFTVTPESIMDAIVRGGVGQLLNMTTGIKIDLYMREGVPGELSRSVVREIAPGFDVRVVSIEDAILAKLIWIRKGSHRSRRDVRWLHDVLSEAERKSVEKSAQALGLHSLLIEVMSDVEPRE